MDKSNYKQWRQWVEKVVKEDFPIMTYREIYLKHKITFNEARYVVRKFHLHKDKSIENHKRSRSLIRTYKTEHVRLLSGIPQSTRIKIRMLPVKVYYTKWRLARKFNYFSDPEFPYVLFYDVETKRIDPNRKVNEEHYTRKYGIVFEAAD